MRGAALAVVSVLAAGSAAGPALAQDRCRLALVLGLDVSSSVNEQEYQIQLQGLAHAFRTPEVVDALLSPPGTVVAVTVYEWSGRYQQDVIVGWTFLGSEEKVLAFADRLAAHERSYAEFPTAVGKALEFGAAQFGHGPACERRVIDLSGDGANNDGVGPSYFRNLGDFDGIVINGLAIQGAEPDPAEYYRNHVMHGPGAFVVTARDFEDYPYVIIGKLLKEVASELIVGERP